MPQLRVGLQSEVAMSDDPRPAVPEPTPKRQRLRIDKGIRALETFAKSLEQMAPHERSALIRWLASKYGVRMHR